MYYPYFRGKQFELITIRETAKLMAGANFVAVIEPVREALSGLGRALNAISDANGKAVVVVNPDCGDHSEDGAGISAFLRAEFDGRNGISAGILLKSGMGVAEAMGQYQQHVLHDPVFIHAGFSDAKGLADALADNLGGSRHIFFEDSCGKLYRKHFRDGTRILIRDGFRRQKNSAYPDVEAFSDLHVTFEEEDMDGFGDFLIVGNEFSEGGGPAYAVAIHLTYIDPRKDDVMFVYHFVSTSNDTPTDPAGKFGQALEKLAAKLDSGMSNLFVGDAIKEFRELHAKGHFPGLGYVKKLSMKHHIETLASYFAGR